MTNCTIRTLWGQVRLGLVGAVLVSLAACGVSHSGTGKQDTSTADHNLSTSASNAEAQAMAPATAAQTELKLDHYNVGKDFPGWGKVAVGFSTSNKYRYEAVVTAKTTQDAQDVVMQANKDPQPGVTIKAKGLLVIISATDLKALNSAREAYWSYLKSKAKSSL